MTFGATRGARWRARYGAALLALAGNFIAARVQARPEYPGELQTAVGMECPPPCQACHLQATGGANWNPFGLRLVRATTVHTPWPQIVAALRQADQDSDGDGRLDMSELDNDTNPSLADNDQIDCPRYGCGARLAAAERQGTAPGVLALGVMLLVLLGRRARHGH